MQTEELFELTTWVKREIVSKNMVQLFSQLHAILEQNAQPNTAKAPFEKEKTVLIETIRKVPLTDLSNGQIEILENIGIAKNVGKNGVILVEDILYKNALDVASAVSTFQKIIGEINTGIQWAEQANGVLKRIVDEEYIVSDDANVVIRIHFMKEAHLANLTEFKEWGKIWYEIGRGVAIVNGEAPDNIEIIGASKGSLILVLACSFGISKTISKIIMEALKVIDRIFDIKKKAEEIRAMKLANDQVEKSLNAAAEQEKDQGSKAIVKMMIEEYGLEKPGQGDKNTELTNAIKKLIDFVEKGGEIDFVLPESNENADKPDATKISVDERETLRDMFKEVRALESKLKLIEYSK